MAKREYKDEFLKVGFTFIKDKGTVRPQCVVCYEVLSNESLKLNKLKRHLETKHSDLSNKDRTFFETKETHIKRQRLDSGNKSVCCLEKVTLASYHVAWRIARQKKPHSIGENLIKPAAIDMIRLTCGDEYVKKIEQIPLSNDTICKRIQDMSIDIKKQVISGIKNSGQFSLQMDETTDISDEAQLMAYIRYAGLEEMEEEFLFCHPLTTTTTGADIFNFTDSFFREEGLSWSQCHSICTDGAPSMLGVRQGLSARIKDVNPQTIVFHCLLHRQNLASKRLSKDFDIVMQEVIKIVNFIKARSLNNRIFAQMCLEMGSEYTNLLYHSEVKWLSRGNVLQRILKMHKEIEIFLTEKCHPLCSRFSDQIWIVKLAYLSDIFDELNKLNASMQGRDHTVIDLSEKISTFKGKLKLWKKKIEENKVASFPNLNLLLEDKNVEFKKLQELKDIIIDHLQKLDSAFDRYIPEDMTKYSWVRNPFDIDVEDLPDHFQNISGLQEELIELKNDGVLHHNFQKQKKSLSSFWTKLRSQKPILVKEVMNVLLPFATTYLCEAGFSTLSVMKSKYRSRLRPEHDLRCCLSKTLP